MELKKKKKKQENEDKMCPLSSLLWNLLRIMGEQC